MTSHTVASRAASNQRFSDITSENNRMMTPIAGFQKIPLVSIDKAVEPLVDLIPQVKRMVDQIKTSCLSPADGLTADESASIMLYTLEWNPSEASFYLIFNKTLRATDRSKLQPWFLYLKLLLFSLSKLPSVKANVYRGVKGDLHLHGAYQKNREHVWWGFSSCTTTIDVLSQSNFLGKTGPRTMFNIETYSGKNISNHSTMPNENEVLILPARKFKVIGTLDLANDLQMIQMKEVESNLALFESVNESVIPKSLPMPKKATVTPPYPARWQTNAITVAGGHGRGDGMHQFHHPYGLHVDDDQTIYIADFYNHRIMAWKTGATAGEVLAGGNGMGNRLDQLNEPTDIVVERETDTLLVCDWQNRRVMRWPRHSPSSHQPELVIDKVHCWRLTMDNHGSFYMSDTSKHEVRRYDKDGGKKGTVVAGGQGQGAKIDQLNCPTYLFIDAQFNVYVSDTNNHRVMKWTKGATEGVVVAGGNGQGKNLKQLDYPGGVWADDCGHVYVVDLGNNRVVRWEKGAKQGTVIAGGNEEGSQANQLSGPEGLFFDHHGHLYVTDLGNHRVQRFSLIAK